MDAEERKPSFVVVFPVHVASAQPCTARLSDASASARAACGGNAASNRTGSSSSMSSFPATAPGITRSDAEFPATPRLVTHRTSPSTKLWVALVVVSFPAPARSAARRRSAISHVGLIVAFEGDDAIRGGGEYDPNASAALSKMFLDVRVFP